MQPDLRKPKDEQVFVRTGKPITEPVQSVYIDENRPAERLREQEVTP